MSDEKRSYSEVADELWDGLEFGQKHPLQDTEENRHRFDLDVESLSFDVQFENAKTLVKRWCEFDDRNFVRAEQTDKLGRVYFYFEPPFESLEEKWESLSYIFGGKVG